MDLNPSQRQAVIHGKGPMIVLAGPGSGKTAVITQRTKYLIEHYGVDPKKILVITFTKAAAEEMKSRFVSCMGGNNLPVNFGTFHAIYFTILKYAYNYKASSIIPGELKKQYLKEIIDKLELEFEDEKEFIGGIESEISLVKGERMNLDHYYSINCSEEIFKQIYQEYDSRLRKADLIDFDDMLVLCYELLIKRPDILAGWQKKYEYILIDEFQDINKVQYDIICLLAKPENNLFIVGDDDQSIYRFRGAKPEIMLNFQKEFSDTRKVLLDVNYRSTEQVIEGAKRVIKNNKKRYQKNIKHNQKSGENIRVKIFNTLNDENNAVIEEIRNYYNKGVPYSEMAVLFRTNTQPRALLGKLMEFNIPFKMKDNIPNIYDHWIAKNLIAYVKIAMGSKERGLFLQIANRPNRYIPRDCFQEPIVEFYDIMRFFSGKEWMMDRITKLEYDLNMLKKMTPYAAINYIRKGIGYEAYLEEYAKYRRIKSEELLEVLNEIQESVKNFETYEEWFLYMENYESELREQMRNQNNKNEDSVSMATMHSSKGLEFQTVFIIDANEGITPHHKAVLDADLEEERRMFYVAMTRAKEFLHIYAVKERYNKEQITSRFVGELLLDQETLVKGAKIEHKMYGGGSITENKDGKLTIYFERLKKNRTVDLKFCVSNNLIKIIDSQ